MEDEELSAPFYKTKTVAIGRPVDWIRLDVYNYNQAKIGHYRAVLMARMHAFAREDVTFDVISELMRAESTYVCGRECRGKVHAAPQVLERVEVEFTEAMRLYTSECAGLKSILFRAGADATYIHALMSLCLWSKSPQTIVADVVGTEHLYYSLKHAIDAVSFNTRRVVIGILSKNIKNKQVLKGT